MSKQLSRVMYFIFAYCDRMRSLFQLPPPPSSFSDHPFLCLSSSFLCPVPSSLDLVMLIYSVTGSFSQISSVGLSGFVILSGSHHLPLTVTSVTGESYSEKLGPVNLGVWFSYVHSLKVDLEEQAQTLAVFLVYLFCGCPQIYFEFWAISP